jgi:hypothetical protein
LSPGSTGRKWRSNASQIVLENGKKRSGMSNASPHDLQRGAIFNHDDHIPGAPQRGHRSRNARPSLRPSELTTDSTIEIVRTDAQRGAIFNHDDHIPGAPQRGHGVATLGRA